MGRLHLSSRVRYWSALAASVAAPALLLATPSHRLTLAEAYPEAPSSQPAWLGAVASCNTCHYRGEGPELNLYGKAFEEAGYDLLGIDSDDSDGDGFSNGDEIRAGTNPALDPVRFILRLLGDPAVTDERFPNANGDRTAEGQEILDVADLIFRFEAP